MDALARSWQATAVCALVLSAVLAAWWGETGRLRITGDEPHYLIISASVARDQDFDVRNNYEEDFRTAEIFGPVNVHAARTSTAWWPMHTPGLGVLLALPWALGGVLGARLALYLIVVPLLAVGSWRWLRESLSPREAALAVAGLVGSVPVVFAGSQLYPDLPCGVIVLALLTWVWGALPRSLPAWHGYWLVAGLLPWLHTKYFAASLILAAMGAWQAWRDRRRIVELVVPALLFLVGTGSLMWWHLRTFGGVLGWRRLGHLELDPLRALEIFLGLHLDQAQGLFLQQPLLLPGLIGLGYMLRRRHSLTVPWLLLYGSLVVPNALEVNSYGGGGPSGRFAWAAMWLWIVPLGVWLREVRATVEPYVRPIVLLALAYQAGLAVRWAPVPTALFPYYSELVWERNSLLPVAVRYSFPSFYFWDFESYLAYLPNVLWVTGVVLLVVTGYCWREAVLGRLRTAWVGLLVVMALVLPAEPTADSESRADRERSARALESMHRSLYSLVRQRFEAERMAPEDLREATAVDDPLASSGRARVSRPAHRSGFVMFGPWVDLDPGRYRAEVALRLEGAAPPGTTARFSVFAAGTRRLVARRFVPVEALQRERYVTVALAFESEDVLEDVAFRVRTPPELALRVDYVDLIPVLP